MVPGNTEESLLIEALKHEGLEMPPKGKLPEAVIADFVKWVEMELPDPRDRQGRVGEEGDQYRSRKAVLGLPAAEGRRSRPR